MATMEGYKGRKAPNVPHFLANLNALPSAHEAATQQQQQHQQQRDDYNIADELAQFTNTEFLDFDAGDFLERPMPEYDPTLEEKARRENAAANKKIDGQGMDFVIGMSHVAHDFWPDAISFINHLRLPSSALAAQKESNMLSQSVTHTFSLTKSHTRRLPLHQHRALRHQLSPIRHHRSDPPSSVPTQRHPTQRIPLLHIPHFPGPSLQPASLPRPKTPPLPLSPNHGLQ